jgi:hypothetical protein
VPGLEEDFGSDAAAFLAQLVGNGKRFSATVVKRERGGGAREKHPRKAADKLHVVLKADGDEKLDVAREMLLEGLARLPRLHKVGLFWHWVRAAVAARTAQLGDGMQPEPWGQQLACDGAVLSTMCPECVLEWGWKSAGH